MIEHRTIDLGEAKGLSLRREAPMPLSLREYDRESLDVIRNTVASCCNDTELVAFLTFCKNSGWDPFQKEIYAIVRKEKGGGRKLCLQAGIDGLRRKAHETGLYAGMEEPEFGPPVKKQVDRSTFNVPSYCRFVIYKMIGGRRVPFSFTARWNEYAPPLHMSGSFRWRQAPYGQLEKCAEAGVLRRAFAEQLRGVYEPAEFEHADAAATATMDLPDERMAPADPPPVRTEARVVDDPPSGQAQPGFGEDLDAPADPEALAREAAYAEWEQCIQQACDETALEQLTQQMRKDDRLDAGLRKKLAWKVSLALQDMRQ